MSKTTAQQIRQMLLEEIKAAQPNTTQDPPLQRHTILSAISQRLKVDNQPALEQLILTEWYSLFNCGYLAWGHNLVNCSPPFFHVTAQGKTVLEELGRSQVAEDPAYLNTLTSLSPVAASYLREGLCCHASGHYKAAAVMIAAAAESLALALRDHLVQRLGELGQWGSTKLSDWRMKTVLEEFHKFVDTRKESLPGALRDNFVCYWPAFIQQVRTVRSEAGHPSSVEPIAPETVQASLLTFSQLVPLAAQLHQWIDGLKK